MQIGDHVRVKPPFDAAFPGVYTVDALRPDLDNGGSTVTIFGANDFHEQFLEVTADAVTHPSPGANTDGVPETISAAQARAVLLQQGLLAQVTAMVDDPATPQIIKIFWEYEHTLHRASPALNQMAAALGLSAAQIDALFVAAKAIQV